MKREDMIVDEIVFYTGERVQCDGYRGNQKGLLPS